MTKILMRTTSANREGILRAGRVYTVGKAPEDALPRQRETYVSDERAKVELENGSAVPYDESKARTEKARRRSGTRRSES